MSGSMSFSAVKLVSEVKKSFEGEKLNNIISSAKDKDIVIFLGYTGTGKSTMLNYLAGCTMIEDDEGNIIVSEESEIKLVADVGHSLKESKTFLPSFRESSSLTYYDSPGFGDTKGIIQEVINAKLIRELAKNAKSVRFAVLLRESHATDRGSRSLMLGAFDAVRNFFSYDKEVPLTIFLTHVSTKKIAREKLLKNVKDNIVTSTEFKNVTVKCFDPLDKELRGSIVKSLQDLNPLALKEKAIKIPLGDKEKAELKTLLYSEVKSLETEWRSIKESLLRDCKSYLLPTPALSEVELKMRLDQVEQLIQSIEVIKLLPDNLKAYEEKLRGFPGSSAELKSQLTAVKSRYQETAQEIQELIEEKPFKLVELADLKPMHELGRGLLIPKSWRSHRRPSGELYYRNTVTQEEVAVPPESYTREGPALEAYQELVRRSWRSYRGQGEQIYYQNTVTQEKTELVPVGYTLEGPALEVKQEQERQAAYELERQRKAAEQKAAEEKLLLDAKDSKAVEQLLSYVADGEQDKAEALLKSRPGLALGKGTVTDMSGRTFREITAFQYALWALDWHMWEMILKYFPEDNAVNQLLELEEKGTSHGSSANWQDLIDALDTYVRNYEGWSYEQCCQHFQKVIGGAQRRLPVHVVNEYCRTDRSFNPTPSFTEYLLPRTRQGDTGEWWTATYNGGQLGDKFCWLRQGLGRPLSDHPRTKPFDFTDKMACEKLLLVRQSQLRDLKLKLQARLLSKLQGYLSKRL